MNRLQHGLEENSFSSIQTQDLPLSTTVIATAAASSPRAMTVEVIGFAIIARNTDLVANSVFAVNQKELDLSSIYPFHLAASYLDRSSICYDMFYYLSFLVKQNAIRRLYLNDFGHTVLDSLMLTILTGHTSCTPVMIDERLKSMTRFPGEDIDICGRWDADSPIVRGLKANGSPRIPFSWKHMFCHISVRAVCHAITRIFSVGHSPDINTPSGLFAKYCFTCGDKLVLGPIHTLVPTAFNLAQNGCDGENLFGMLSCLVCLLVHGANPAAEANLSVDALLGIDKQQEFAHEFLTPLHLAERVPSKFWDTWSEEVKLGWECLLAVLRFVQPDPIQGLSPPYSSHGESGDCFSYSVFLSPQDLSTPASLPLSEHTDSPSIEHGSHDLIECYHEPESSAFCVNTRQLRVLWSAIQTELVTYRRLRDGNSWLSANFSLVAVRDGANYYGGFSRLPFVYREMLKPVCACGRFYAASESHGVVVTDEACSFYFSNMEDWQRSSYRALYD